MLCLKNDNSRDVYDKFQLNRLAVGMNLIFCGYLYALLFKLIYDYHK